MKRRIHILLLLTPLMLWIIWIVLNSFGQSQVDKQMRSADGMIWQFPQTEIRSTVKNIRNGELDIYTIHMIDENSVVIYENRLTIDWDMSGGGFLKAIQADLDDDLEIMYVNRGTGRKFYLDVENGQVNRKPFKSASENAKRLAERWLTYYAPNHFHIGGLFFLTLFYYVLYFPIYRIGRWIFRKVRPVS